MVVDAGALQTFAGGEEMLLRQRFAAELLMVRGARRPGAAPVVIRRERAGDFLEVGQHHAIGDKARAPMRDRGLEQGIGRHASSHCGVPANRIDSCCTDSSSARVRMRVACRFFVAAIPRHEAPRTPVHQQFEADAEGREQQHADEGLVVVIGARVVENVVAEPADREEELRHHRADQRAAGGEPEAGQQIGHRRRQDDIDQRAQAAGAERTGDFKVFARHRARAVGDIHGDGEYCGEDNGADASRARITKPQRKQRQHDDHRHGVKAVDVDADHPVDGSAAAHQQTDGGAGDDRYGQAFGYRRQRGAQRMEKFGVGYHARDRQHHRAWLGHVSRRDGADHDLPAQQDCQAGQETRHEAAGEDGRPRGRGRCGDHGR